MTGNLVITDVRFVNEIQVIHNLGGQTIWVKRNPDPPWLQTAIENKSRMPREWPQIHSSEWDWLDTVNNHTVITNNSSLVELYQQIDNFLLKDKD